MFPSGINSIKNSENRRDYVLKVFACYLHFQKKTSRKSILKSLPLTLNQIKKTFQDYKKGRINFPYHDLRGTHMQDFKKIFEDKLDWIKLWLSKYNCNFTIQDLTLKINQRYPNFQDSISTIRRAVQDDLGLKFLKINKRFAAKNSTTNKDTDISLHVISLQICMMIKRLLVLTNQA